MTEPDSRELLLASQSGNRDALHALIQQHLPQLRVFVRLRMSPLLRARETEDDLVQSACAQLLHGLDGFEYRGEDAFRGWLYTGVLNKLREHERDLRAQKRDARREVALEHTAGGTPKSVTVVYGQVLSPSQAAIADERVRRLEAAFDELPEHYREVLTLSRIAGMSRKAIAEQLGRSEESVRSLVTRARAELAYRLEALGDADGPV